MAVSSVVRSPSQRSAPWLPLRLLGPASIWFLAFAQVVLWVVERPAGVPTARFIGELVGAEAVLLMSIGLILVSSLVWVEPWFDGIDRAAIWHRRVAISGMALLLVHVGLATNPHPSALGPALSVVGMLGLVLLAAWAILPRWQSVAPKPWRAAGARISNLRWVRATRRVFGGYTRWRSLHRTIGVFVAAGFIHGLLDGASFGSAVLRWSYLVVGGTGLVFYVYRELLARYFVPTHDYEVDSLRSIAPDLVELELRPLGRRFAFVPGQFAMIFLEGKDGWHRHPFTIASAPDEDNVRVTVKALGDFTSNLGRLVEPGMPAVIGGAHGRFNHRRGTDHQLWVAAGVGITPFLSWLRSADDGPLAERVDFFYSAKGPAPFSDELRAIAARDARLNLNIVDTGVEGHLTPERVLAAVDDGEVRGLSVFMCGPTAMLSTFETELRKAGVRSAHIHREHFDWR